MSHVDLSNMDFNPQFTDEDEAEREREEAEQQHNLKEFLQHELDDEEFEHSFGSYRSQAKCFSPPLAKSTGEMVVPHGDNRKYLYDAYPGSSYNSAQTHNTNTNSTPQFHNGGVGSYNMVEAGVVHSAGVGSMGYQLAGGKQYMEEPDLHLMYNDRGKKIEELQGEMEKKDKEIRALNHKLTMVTIEKDGFSTSVNEQQKLLSEHKQQISKLQTQVNQVEEEKRQLNNQIKELSEKLEASDCAIDTLQTQIKQLDQTESISRQRAQHESMLATMRQRQSEELLTLKEKIDSLKQDLAWQTENCNRYKEMLDSNSSVSEIGILHKRLCEEEKKSKECEKERDKWQQQCQELEEQLRLYEGVVKKPNLQPHFTSTPMVHSEELTEPKTPKSNIHDPLTVAEDLSCARGMTGDSSFREELVKSLAINREKRQQINVLREQNQYLQTLITGKKSTYQLDRDTQTENIEMVSDPTKTTNSCENCNKTRLLLDDKTERLRSTELDLGGKIAHLQNANHELKSNMEDMVMNYDRQKVVDIQSQNNAMLQLIDDAKENMRKDMELVHAKERNTLQSKVDSLNEELLHTKEDYLKLCSEAKDTEDELRKEFESDRRRELEVMKQSLEHDHTEKCRKQELTLTSKFIDDMESEKKKWHEEHNKDLEEKIEKAVLLAKSDWIENNKMRLQGHDIEELKLKCERYELKVQDMEKKCQQQQVDFDVTLTGTRISVEKELKDKFDDKLQVLIKEEKKRLDVEREKFVKEGEDKQNTIESTLQSELNQQSAALRKTELDLKLKTALWNRTESEMKRKLEAMEKENKSAKKCEKCEEDAREKQDSSDKRVIGDVGDMCDVCRKFLETEKSIWQAREKDLLAVLEEAQQQIRVKLGNMKKSDQGELTPGSGGDSSCSCCDGESGGGDCSCVTKEKDFVSKIEELSKQVHMWKELYDRDEKCVSELKNNIGAMKEDMLAKEKEHRKLVDDLHSELASTKESMMNIKNELSTERDKGSKTSVELKFLRTKLSDTETKNTAMVLSEKGKNDKHSKEIGELTEEVKAWMQRCNEIEADKNEMEEKKNDMEVKKTQLDRNITILRGEKITLETNYQVQVKTLQQEILMLKDQLSAVQKKLSDEKDKCGSMELEMKSLTNASLVEKHVGSEYEGKIKDISLECSRWKEKCKEVEKENAEHACQIEAKLATMSNSESYYRKHWESAQQECCQLKEHLTQLQNSLFMEKERCKMAEMECKQLTDNYNINLENVLSIEKQKWEMESQKLHEVVKKASEVDHNNFVKDMAKETRHANELKKLKEEHSIQVNNLKQSFRDKLARITEMKKKWIDREEEKRMELEEKTKEKYSRKLSEVQQQHETILRDQQAHWIKQIHENKKQQVTTVMSLSEEVKAKDIQLLKERKSFDAQEAQSQQKLNDLVTQHERKISQLKIEHLSELQRQKARLQQYYTLLNERPAGERDGEGGNEMSDKNIVDKDKDFTKTDSQLHRFYVEALARIEEEVMQHVAIMRENADNEIKEAVQAEREKIFQELKKKGHGVMTSSPNLENDPPIGSALLLNSIDYG